MTDWKPTMLTASAPSGEMMTWINPSAIEQLQREVDALKAQAAPTPAAPTPEPSAELVALRARCERLRNLLAAGQTIVRSWPILKDEQPIDAHRFRWLNEVNGALAALDAAEGKGR